MGSIKLSDSEKAGLIPHSNPSFFGGIFTRLSNVFITFAISKVAGQRVTFSQPRRAVTITSRSLD
jgi:hypothetical protein